MIRRLFDRLAGRDRDARSEAIVWAYRLFLDREPESAAVVEGKAAALASSPEIRRAFTSSSEYRERPHSGARPSLTGFEAPMHIEEVEDPQRIGELLAHIARTWTRFGETEPHFSVLTDERFKPERIDAERDAFNASGSHDVERFVATLARAGIEPPFGGTCLELGCGVGRVTAWLARAFARVVGVDVSASHLAIAQAHLDAGGARNVELHRLASVATLDALPRFDAFFSVIVLQHNPPPVIAAILDRVFARLNPGGVAYFQVPTYRAGYRFELDAYLRDDLGRNAMEMHVLPQRSVMRVALRHGVDLIELVEDGSTGMRPGEVSNTFLFRKRDSA